jgi:hypothetical protein
VPLVAKAYIAPVVASGNKTVEQRRRSARPGDMRQVRQPGVLG